MNFELFKFYWKKKIFFSDDEQQEKEEDIKKEAIDTPWGRKEEDTKDGDNSGDDDDDSDAEKVDNDDDQNESNATPSDETEKPENEKIIADDGGIDLSKLSAALFKSKSNRSIQMNKKSDKQAPRIDDAAEFPDLGATDEAIADAKTFQPVRSGLISSRIVAQPPPPLPRSSSNNDRYESLQTDNKFNALRNKGW